MEAVRSNSKWNRWQIKNGTKQVDGNLTSFVTACSQKNAVKAAISIEDETDVIERCLLRPQLNIRMFCRRRRKHRWICRFRLPARRRTYQPEL
ncbi:uncharacterized protein LOC134227183 isoform X2 [Armigeres subalbatus]|uniref:uncharacterized protein LOC134227183 isoform X2 n=1 Tax=Armigeres subalbatus TaxID=124917 RepID=UPI002ED23147